MFIELYYLLLLFFFFCNLSNQILAWNIGTPPRASWTYDITILSLRNYKLAYTKLKSEIFYRNQFSIETNNCFFGYSKRLVVWFFFMVTEKVIKSYTVLVTVIQLVNCIVKTMPSSRNDSTWYCHSSWFVNFTKVLQIVQGIRYLCVFTFYFNVVKIVKLQIQKFFFVDFCWWC